MAIARIEKGRVLEIIETDTVEGKFHPSLTWVEVPSEVRVGWEYIDGNFVDTLERESREQEEQELLESLKPSEKEVRKAEIVLVSTELLLEVGLL